MKLGLFLLSVLAFVAASYFLATDLISNYDDSNHLIYIMLLVILLCNSLIGIMITFPEAFVKRRKFKITTVKK